MSGPKTSRYTLTAEQRRILAEQRRVQMETQKQVMQLKAFKQSLKERITKIDSGLSQYQRIVKETGEKKLPLENVKEVRDKAMQELNDAAIVSESSGLTVIQETNAKLRQIQYLVMKQQQVIFKELAEVDKKFRKEIESAVAEGFEVSFAGIVEDITPDVSVYIKKITEAMDEVKEYELSQTLKERYVQLKLKAEEIDSVDFIENYYAMSIVPYVKECKAYHCAYVEYGDKFKELLAEYRILAGELGVQSKDYIFSMEAINELTEKVKEMELKRQEQEEQEYISRCMDSVLEAMGYKTIGEREIIKKDGRRFHNELYLFDEGTAVNVTYSSNGQITMELGGLDQTDRIPSDDECRSLAEDMVSFCDDYFEIEKKLKKSGVVTQRISVLPPEAQFAQIINTSDYIMTENVENYESKHTKKSGIIEKQLRRGE
ncbi:hypothetical protein [[Clostridium] scindens]|uniref:hypothetical protein n=1 Tax=Clostridium scindens (strain JCM 10418 / VPI 12708) TaxID=29347 RepID=UPI002432F87B|nr:hypothetical protein [[Clostridium] scindens]